MSLHPYPHNPLATSSGLSRKRRKTHRKKKKPTTPPHTFFLIKNPRNGKKIPSPRSPSGGGRGARAEALRTQPMGQCLLATPQPSAHPQHLGGPPHPPKNPCTVWKLPRELPGNSTSTALGSAGDGQDGDPRRVPDGVGGAWGGGVCVSASGSRGGTGAAPARGWRLSVTKGGRGVPPLCCRWLLCRCILFYFVFVFFFFPFYKTRKIHLLFFISPAPFPPPYPFSFPPLSPVFLSVSGEAAPLPSPQILGRGGDQSSPCPSQPQLTPVTASSRPPRGSQPPRAML